MIVDFSIAPIGRGESLSRYVAEAYRIIEASGVRHEFHAMGTNLEGDWGEVMTVVNACRLRLLETCGRVSISLRIDDRKGASDRLGHKVASAQEKAGL
ncbi:MAG: MTH1187 family thiamine-binding protein [Candidatus Bipolaricaulota bacterium]|nr:MTH1187 family thiamine-binding protein [Candidatus Bipolaricaulota bacterium]